MTPHLRRSRITKAIVDRPGLTACFLAAEQRLATVRVAVLVDAEQNQTPAGQAAALTALATSLRCFGSAVLVADGAVPLVKLSPLGAALGAVAAEMGAAVASRCPEDITHCIVIGHPVCPSGAVVVRCWWDRWLAGALPDWDTRPLGGSLNPLAGVFASAIAMRQVFTALVGGDCRVLARELIASLWTPWVNPDVAGAGPDQASVPPRLWFIGLGHLGQGVLWNLGLLPLSGQLAILQDDQVASVENEATGLLTTAADIDRKKTRIAAQWLDVLGWPTSLIERRHYGDIPLLPTDPLIVVTALDEPEARKRIASGGFEYMIDVGVGHGPIDFENLQIRILRKGTDLSAFWSSPEPSKDVAALMQKDAYRAHMDRFGECGSFSLAEASVAVPFVGAAAGALLIAQLMRLSSMEETPQIMQMDLGCPAMVITGRFNAAPSSSFGSLEMRTS